MIQVLVGAAVGLIAVLLSCTANPSPTPLPTPNIEGTVAARVATQIAVQPTETPSPSATFTASPTITPKPIPTPTLAQMPTPSATPIPTPTPTQRPGLTPIASSLTLLAPMPPETGSIVFEGFEGSLTTQITPSFQLVEGIVIVSVKHNGNSGFRFDVVPNPGNPALFGIPPQAWVERISIGPTYLGAFANRVSWAGLPLSSGLFHIEVRAIGEWRVEITQPQWDNGRLLPLNLSGNGDVVVAPILLREGIFGWEITHDGFMHFKVELVRVDGENNKTLASVMGPYDKGGVEEALQASIIGLRPGVFALAIQADGNWTISLSEWP